MDFREVKTGAMGVGGGVISAELNPGEGETEPWDSEPGEERPKSKKQELAG